MPVIDAITQPTLLLDEARCRANIARMANKAHKSGVRFRPHFKTHQSAEIGEWFRPRGVEAITVSSIWMADYFSRHGWSDITIAFPVNLRQVEDLRSLARRVRLGLLVDSVETVSRLAEQIHSPVDLWIELDVGQHRSGIAVTALPAIQQVAVEIGHSKQLHLRGVLAHAGHLYHAASIEQVRGEYRVTIDRLQELREAMCRQGFDGFEISWGDTPTCSLVEDLSGVDEIRPGNFVFYDVEQFSIGACREEDIAVALACPVVSKPAGLGHAVVHGGAVHLSKEFIEIAGQRLYGEIALPQGNGWGSRLPGAFVSSLSQEHGVVQLKPGDLQVLSIGDLLLVLPVHSCLTVDLMQNYLTLDGHPISTLGKPGLT